ncbi:hypothetical protein GCM10009000_084980 [Halobacterium noricense]|uniref:Periplasmic copper-binding protein NosD beta helix domain-containing protein n=1 Tax=Haladaptatus pallidirubidus TaxID=1008152 RepID=A0AAV3URD2_9EURY
MSNPHGVSDVTVRSVKATRWNRGVHIANASDIMIRDVDAWRNAEGVTIWNSTNSKVIGGRLTNNLFGIIIDQPSNDISISSIHFEGNTVGNVSRGEYNQDRSQPHVQRQ